MLKINIVRGEKDPEPIEASNLSGACEIFEWRLYDF